MMKYVLLLALSMPLFAFAQNQRTGNLTIFSEGGDKFYLVLNGEKQNDIPQSNIRIEELPQPYYSARIIFADQSISALSKNNLMITDADGTFMDVTYKIRRDKQGKPKLNYFSSIEVQRDFIPPSGMYVHRYGESINMDVDGGAVTKTTTTTTTNVANASINVPGVSMNVTINDPDDAFTRTTTTRSTTTTTTTSSGDISAPTRPERGRGCNGWPMKAGDFSAARKTIQDAAFDDSKLSTAKTIVSANCLTTDQVISICGLFNFEENKLAFAKYAYKYTTDPKNYFKVGSVFVFDGSKTELNEFISSEQN